MNESKDSNAFHIHYTLTGWVKGVERLSVASYDGNRDDPARDGKKISFLTSTFYGRVSYEWLVSY